MGRVYSVVFEEVAVAAAQDLFNIVAPSDSPVDLLAVYLGQSSDAGDANSEQLPILIHRGTSDGTGGTTPTARPMNVGDAAFGGTLRVNDVTTQGAEGNQIYADAFNILAGFQWVPPPECRPRIPASGRLIIELQTAPLDSIDMSGTIFIEELGG